MGILTLNLPPIPLHASTQVDNRSVEKAQFLEKVGFKQIVLARELDIKEIRAISQAVSVPLEAFIHGALCVCYSGQCYLSQALSGRSANKGACAQYCRLPYDLIDKSGDKIFSKKHLLSMKDLNLSDELEVLIDSGVSSLKIEGRLKDIAYVKNTVAYYRKKLDAILEKRPEYTRSSSGYTLLYFEPNLEKSFNRGFTKYFLNGRLNENEIWSINSPKSIGEFIGIVSNTSKNEISIKTDKKINNGDGLCYFDNNNELQGIQVNRADRDKIYVFDKAPEIKKGTKIYRNFDHEFDKFLQKENSAERKINIDITIADSENGFTLTAIDEDNNTSKLNVQFIKEVAQKDQTENIIKNLSKTGNTVFSVNNIDIKFDSSWFIPSSALSEWRRELIDELSKKRVKSYKQETTKLQQTNHAFPEKTITYLGNIMNKRSEQFYTQHQSQVIQPAFEQRAQKDVPLMFTRHCIKQSLGWCPKEGGQKHPYQEPFYLICGTTRLRLSFDCKLCEMKIFEA